VQGFVETGFKLVLLLDRCEHFPGRLMGVVDEERGQEQGQQHQPMTDHHQDEEIDGRKGKINSSDDPLLLKNSA